jgi:Ca2+-binding RTX toxin-like protein
MADVKDMANDAINLASDFVNYNNTQTVGLPYSLDNSGTQTVQVQPIGDGLGYSGQMFVDVSAYDPTKGKIVTTTTLVSGSFGPIPIQVKIGSPDGKPVMGEIDVSIRNVDKPLGVPFGPQIVGTVGLTLLKEALTGLNNTKILSGAGAYLVTLGNYTPDYPSGTTPAGKLNGGLPNLGLGPGVYSLDGGNDTFADRGGPTGPNSKPTTPIADRGGGVPSYLQPPSSGTANPVTPPKVGGNGAGNPANDPRNGGNPTTNPLQPTNSGNGSYFSDFGSKPTAPSKPVSPTKPSPVPSSSGGSYFSDFGTKPTPPSKTVSPTKTPSNGGSYFSDFGTKPTPPSKPPSSGGSYFSDFSYKSTPPSKTPSPSKSSGGYDKVGTPNNSNSKGSNSRGPRPVLLDLDGQDGVEITEISRSNIFMDAGGDGLLHRTAWAGAGDGVLFFDANGDGTISEKREYVFTEWDPTATSDLAALKSAFDTNGDSKLTGAELNGFKVMVTKADGSTEVKTMAELGITEIALNGDTTEIVLPDGSVITAQATYTRNGVTGTLADVTLVAEKDGHRIVQTTGVDAANTRTTTTKAYDKAGVLLYSITSVSNATGTNISNSYDDNGDGVVDRLQTVVTTTNAQGVKSELLINKLGNNASTAVVTSRQETVTSADGKTITVYRDSTGGNWWDSRETRVTNADNSRTFTIVDLAQNGNVISGVTKTFSIDGKTRTESLDLDGNGSGDTVEVNTVATDALAVRTETKTIKNNDTTIRATETTTISANGKDKTILNDFDGDGQIDTRQITQITGAAGSATTSTVTVRNGDNTLRSAVTVQQSADALSKTTFVDADGNTVNETKIVNVTTINVDQSRVEETTTTNQDTSVREKVKVTLGADKVTTETWIDQNQDGVFQATDLVKSVTVTPGTGERTATNWVRNPDGTIVAKSVIVTSQNGLSETTTVDADGDTDTDVISTDVTVIQANTSSIRTIEIKNSDNSLRSKSETTTSADGLTVTTLSDVDGVVGWEAKSLRQTVLNVDQSTVSTISNYAGNGTTLLSSTKTEQSANRRTVTITTDADGDTKTDSVVRSVEDTTGLKTVTKEAFNSNGILLSRSSAVVNANGLVTTTSVDANADDKFESVTTDTTVLNSNGSVERTIDVNNGNGTDRTKTVNWTRDDGFESKVYLDVDGNNLFEREQQTLTVLNGVGDKITTVTVKDQNGTPLTRSQVEVNDDGFRTITRSDNDGNSGYDFVTTTTTVIGNDGGTTVTAETRDAATVLRNRTVSITSDDIRNITISRDINGDGNNDFVETRVIADNGTLTVTRSTLGLAAALQSRTEVSKTSNGLITTENTDADGNGTYETVRTSTNVLNVTGTSVLTTELRSSTNFLMSKSVTTTSDDGLQVDSTQDWDGNNVVDQTWSSVKAIAANGVTTDTLQIFNRDNSLNAKTVVVTDPTGRSVTTTTDLDGNGIKDRETVDVMIANDGSRTLTTSYFSVTGQLLRKVTDYKSGNGLRSFTEDDRNGDGAFDSAVQTYGVLAADGSTTWTTSYSTNTNPYVAGIKKISSDDSLTVQTNFDLNGDRAFEYNVTDATTFAANGDVTQSLTTKDAANLTLATKTVVSSGNGLNTQITVDTNGNGTADRTTSTVKLADLSATETSNWYSLTGVLKQKTVTITSSDQRTVVSTVDVDGNAVNDYRVTNTVQLDKEQRSVLEKLSSTGTVTASLTTKLLANGMVSETAIDTDANGTVDIKRGSVTTPMANGELVITKSEFAGALKTFGETWTRSASGLITTIATDVDGNGVNDETRVDTTTLNANGSKTFTSITNYADGVLRNASTNTVSADGRSSAFSYDRDGNGIIDREWRSETKADGAVSQSESFYTGAGYDLTRSVVSVSNDGLVTTIERDGVRMEKTVRSLVSSDIYSWTNGVTATTTAANIVAEHAVDAQGFMYWTMKSTILVGVTPTLTTYSVRLDDAGYDRAMVRAASVYDTVLDRDMWASERESLVKYMSSGELDVQALTTDLLALSEYGSRYGTLANSEFITQTYLNSLGRAPTLAEATTFLNQIATGTLTKAQFAVNLALGHEHMGVGNGHVSTNTTDLEMLTPPLERMIDREQAKAMAQRLVDIVYDRNATAQELAMISEKLMTGTDKLADITTQLLTASGAIQGQYTNSLTGLTGAILVDQAFRNMTGALPDATTKQIWVDNLANSRLTTAQFIAMLAESTDHRTAGNAHVAGTVLSLATVNGTPSGDTALTASVASVINGLGGNDTITGSTSSDKLVGGVGLDSMNGASGSDVYEWAAGDGNDTINESSTSVFETDTLSLTNTASTGITLTRSGNNLLITHSASGAVITVNNQFVDSADGRGVEAIKFSDSVTWNLADILSKTATNGTPGADTALTGSAVADNIFGLAGADTITGGSGNDMIVGGLDADTMDGGVGSDTYEWASGDGSDTINDTSTSLNEADTLSLTNTASTGVTLTRSGNNLVVTHTASGAIITVNNRFVGPTDGRGIEAIKFNNGVIWNLNDILSKTITNGTPGADTALAGSAMADNIFGLAGADTITGGGGNDRIVGGLDIDTMDGGVGSDTYEWASGDGGDTINDTSTSLIETDTLSLTNTASTEVTLSRSGNNLLVTHTASGAIITVNNRFVGPTDGRGIEAIKFSNGVTWSLTDILSRTKTTGTTGVDTLTGSAFGDNIFGLDGDDIINAGDGDDFISGGMGGDVIDGGNGIDTVSYATSSIGVVLAFTSANLPHTQHLGSEIVGDTMINVENAIGSAFGDSFWGSAANNRFEGMGGDDDLRGNAGNDILIGGEGSDIVWGGVGADYLDGGSGSDFARFDNSTSGIKVNLIDGTGSGGEAEGDTFVSIESIYGSDYVDELYGSNESNALIGGSNGAGAGDIIWGFGGNDTLTGSGGDDQIFGGDGDDNLSGKAGADQLIGGLGVDTLSYVFGNTGVVVNLATNTATGGDATGDTISGFENITGSSGNDILIGDAGNNIIFGYIGDDIIDGGAGADEISGSSGVSTVTYVNSNAAVQVVIVDGFVITQVSTGDASGDKLTFIQNITGSAFGDTLTGSASANVLNGGAGNDRIDGGAGNDMLYGGDGNDFFDVSTGQDSFDGGAGFDTLYYYTSTTGITVDLSTNLVSRGEAQGDIISGIETVYGSFAGDSILTGDANDNSLYVYGALNKAYGGAGNDTILSGTGADILDGGAGTDLLHYYYSVLGVTISLASNSSTGGDATGDQIIGFENVYGSNTGGDNIAGDGNNNSIWGFGGDDILGGGAGNDVLYGLDGNDTINGGAGNDYIDGGLGNDIAQFSGTFSSYTVGYDASTLTFSLTNAVDGTDTLTGIDTFQFSDLTKTALSMIPNTKISASISATTLSANEGNSGSIVFAFTVTLASPAASAQSVGYVIAGNGANAADAADFASAMTGTVSFAIGEVSKVISVSVAGDTIFEPNETFGVALTSPTSGITLGVSTVSATIVNDDAALLNMINGTTGNDTLVGTSGADQINGFEGNDSIKGGDGNDVLLGGDGQDEIEGGSGADQIDGGVGTTDRVRYSSSTSGVTINLMDGTASGGDAAGDTIINIENIFGSSYSDTLTGSNGNNSITGTGGGDIIYGLGGNDSLGGGSGIDQIYGGDGDDYLDGSAGADVLNGGTGIDSIKVGFVTTVASTVNLTTGTGLGGDAQGDTYVDIENVDTDGGNDTIIGNLSNNNFVGWGGDDNLQGMDGNDNLQGKDGNDTLFGGNGMDFLLGGNGNDTLEGGAGDDSLDLWSNEAVGNDTFIFSGAFGKDTIGTFTAGVGIADMIKLSLGAAFDTFAEVMAVATAVGPSQTVFTFDANTTITVNTVAKIAFVADDFIFF